jgi:hypothetical protein
MIVPDSVCSYTSAIPQQFLSLPPVVYLLQRIYFICSYAPPHVGAHGTWKHYFPRYRERMECLHRSLDTQAVGTMVGPQFGTRCVVNRHRHSPQSLALVGEKCAAWPAVVGLSFRHFWTYSAATCTQPYVVGCVSCPSPAEGEGYVDEGTDRRTGSV